MAHTESNWKTSYDPRRPEYYRPHSSSNPTDDQRPVSTKSRVIDSQARPTSQRKTSKQKTNAERRTDLSNNDHIFESTHPFETHSASSSFQNRLDSPSPSFPTDIDPTLRHSTGSRTLHEDSEAIVTDDIHHQAFHQPNTRKVTKVLPKENSSLSNSRPVQPRSVSASSGFSVKRERKDPAVTPNDVQRLKNIRRHEPVHVHAGPGSKTSLITPDSWKTDPVILRRVAKKAPVTKVTDAPKPVVEQTSVRKEKTIKPKRDKSASKVAPVEKTPAKPAPKEKKSAEELEKIRKYMLEKRQKDEEKLLTEKKEKSSQEKDRKQKLKSLNEQIKKVAQQPLPPSLLRKSSTSTSVPPKDHPDLTHKRMMDLLGPRFEQEPPNEHHTTTPMEQPLILERSASSSSSSSESIVEIQPPKLNDRIVLRSHSEPPMENSGAEHRHQNLLRWAQNLTRDCDTIENKFKYIRPDGTQPFDLIPPSQLKHDDGNLRVQTPVFITNTTVDRKPIIPPKIVRPSGRLSHLNQNRTSEYQDEQLPGVGDLRDPMLEQRVQRDRAAAKIQASYRGYTVRKSLHWIHDKQQLHSEFNKRPIRRPMKTSSYPMNMLDAPGLNLDLRFSDDNFTIGSTLLRYHQRNGNDRILSTDLPKADPSRSRKIPKSSPVQTYSDDYENITSSRSSTPSEHKSIPQKPRVIPQPTRNSASTDSPTSSSSSTPTPTPTPKTHVPSLAQRRRSISPPLPPQMSPDSGRPIYYHSPPPPPPPTSMASHRVLDERRYSPDALERQLNAEFHLLDGVEASMKQVENMERLRSVALAQQEVVSLAQVLKNKPSAETRSSQPVQKSSSSSSSTSSTSKRPSPSTTNTPARRRPTPPSTSPSSSSSESILTAREKHARKKFHSETELQAYEKRLKDIEKKLRLLDKRAAEVLDEKRYVPSPRVPAKSKSSTDSSISEDLPSSSTTHQTAQKATNEASEIHTETFASRTHKDSDSSISSIHQQQSDAVTTDASDIERRIRAYREQLKTKKNELETLKQRKNKENLREQEENMKKQLQTYNQQIETMRRQPATVPSHPSPLKSSVTTDSSSSSSSTSTISIARKAPESSIAEELPKTATSSQSKGDVIEKRVELTRPTFKKERDFFDDDEDDDDDPKKKPLETPRDERDTQHDALSISIATDLAGSSETDNDNSRRPSTDNEKSVLNFTKTLPLPSHSKDNSSSSESSSKQQKPPLPPQQKLLKFSEQSSSSERSSQQQKPSAIVNDYDEDFSDFSNSPKTPTKEPPAPPRIDDIDVESIQEDIEDKPSVHDTNQSVTSKSSGDEQSEILVFVKKSANTTPRKVDEKTLEEDFPPPPVILAAPEEKNDVPYNDDTSHDVSEDEEGNERAEQENKIDKLTDLFLRTFIDEAINQGKAITHLKKETPEQKTNLTQEAQEWMSDEEDLTDEESPEKLDLKTEELSLDLGPLEDLNLDEPRIETARKIVIEEPVQIFVPYTNEQTTQLCQQAIQILCDQNPNFTKQPTTKYRIPESYFTSDQEDNEDIRRNHRAYCQMIFDMAVELLREMYTENVQLAKYPDWQKSKLISKRFYRAKKPTSRREIEQFIPRKILELLNLHPRQITYSKWRVSHARRVGIEKFEAVLDEEIRQTESQWINYDEDCIQLKFDVADMIFEQLLQETLAECLHVVHNRLYMSSISTRL